MDILDWCVLTYTLFNLLFVTGALIHMNQYVRRIEIRLDDRIDALIDELSEEPEDDFL
jgi:hypothetical protein